jgi:hypothetical protein
MSLTVLQEQISCGTADRCRCGNAMIPLVLTRSSPAAWLGLLFLPLGVHLAADQSPGRPPDVERRMELPPPDENAPVPMARELMQVREKDGLVKTYYADVQSVACEDQGCRVVTVRLYWDILGNYQRYELPTGAGLTKQGHQPFTAADHRKLHSILLDPHSPLKWISKDKITLPKAAKATDSKLDAISTPTALSHTDAVVPGAAYTCYTLWHSAYGKINSRMRSWTSEASDQQHLMEYLTSDNEAYVIFAMQQLAERHIVAAEVVEAVVNVASRGDVSLLETALDYLQLASEVDQSDHYFRTIEQLFPAADKRKRVACLTSLSHNTLPAPSGYYDRISRWLPTVNTYQEVHQLLELLTAQQASTDVVVKQAIPLLECKSFLAARRAYDYLRGQQLERTQQDQLKRFREKYKDRL